MGGGRRSHVTLKGRSQVLSEVQPQPKKHASTELILTLNTAISSTKTAGQCHQRGLHEGVRLTEELAGAGIQEAVLWPLPASRSHLFCLPLTSVLPSARHTAWPLHPGCTSPVPAEGITLGTLTGGTRHSRGGDRRLVLGQPGVPCSQRAVPTGAGAG